MTFDEIEKIVEEPLSRFRATYQTSLHSDVSVINCIADQLAHNHGKQLRPLLMMLSAGASGASFNKLEHLAVAMEMLHNATLLHDDVVDDSDLRRGQPSIRKQFGNKVAVLCGDYYLAKVMMLLTDYNNTEVNHIVDSTVMAMSSGEILQQQRSKQLDGDIQHYRDTIFRKTASLMSACTELGALGTPWQEKMKAFGLHFGMAFQLRDDLLDYMPHNSTGKPTGNDLKEHKITLPLIVYLQNADEKRQQEIMDILKQETICDETLMQLIKEIANEHTLSLADEFINNEIKQAESILATIPHNRYKDGFFALMQFLSPSSL